MVFLSLISATQKNAAYYILKGEASKLWQSVVLNNNDDRLSDFKANDFLCELLQENIISTDKKFNKPINSYLTAKIKNNDENYNYFKQILD